jgi:CPA1 family monovalent cation:H+ antiporter
LPAGLFWRWFRLPGGSWKILTWGGLRGGISVALALSLPKGPGADIVVALTYCVVVVSILVQGLTSQFVTRRALWRDPGQSAVSKLEKRQ